MYVAVKGGERAIENAHRLLAHERRGDRDVPEISLDQISGQLSLAVDRVMTEGSLYDRELAALAIKQARGDMIEAIFLVRAFRATLPRFGVTEPVDTGAMQVLTRSIAQQIHVVIQVLFDDASLSEPGAAAPRIVGKRGGHTSDCQLGQLIQAVPREAPAGGVAGQVTVLVVGERHTGPITWGTLGQTVQGIVSEVRGHYCKIVGGVLTLGNVAVRVKGPVNLLRQALSRDRHCLDHSG